MTGHISGYRMVTSPPLPSCCNGLDHSPYQLCGSVRHVHNSSKDVSHSIFPNTVVQSNLVRKVMFDKEKSGIRLLENASICHLLALQPSTYTFIKGEVIFAPGPIDNQCHRTVIRHIAVVYSTYFNLQLDGRPQMKTWRPFCRVETLQSSHQM